MKEIVRQFGAAAVASLVAGLLMLSVGNVSIAEKRGLAEALGVFSESGKPVLEEMDGTAFDQCWRHP